MVAGEASGDLLAARLLAGLRPHLPQARFHGIGGPHMAEQGFVSDWPMDKLSVRGLFEVARALPRNQGHPERLARPPAGIRRSFSINSKATSKCASAKATGSWITSCAKAKRSSFRRMSPHAPVRPPDTLGMVVERRRPPGEHEHVIFYCDNCGALVEDIDFDCARHRAALSARRCSISGTTTRGAPARNAARKSRSRSR